MLQTEKTDRPRTASNSTMLRKLLRLFALTISTTLGLGLGLPSLANASLSTPVVPQGAVAESELQEADSKITGRLLVESNAVETDRSFRVGVLFDIASGWHLYWRNPGDSGLPIRIQWQVDDATIGPAKWPAPEVFHEPGTGFVTFGYDDQALLSTDMTIHTQLDGPVHIDAKVSFLACKEICIPGSLELSRTLTLGGTPEPIPEAAAMFDAYEARVPKPIEDTGLVAESRMSQDAVRPGDSFVLAVGVRDCGDRSDCKPESLRTREPASNFIPYDQTNPVLRPLGVQSFPASDNGFLIAMRGHIERDAPLRSEASLRGILSLPDVGYVEVTLPFPTREQEATVALIATDWLDAAMLEPTATARIALGYALVLALLGGLILNLMPCVLPVLAIKIVSISQLVHQPRRHIAMHGLVYAAGIQASMAILAGAVVLLRQAGTAVGWGFQFQEPVFLAAITLLVVLFACNLFGWFEINLDTSRIDGVGRESSGLRRSFFDGFLAVALATPCSAPFLGTAVGFAFAGGTLDIVAIFAGIGTGLALPFVAVSMIPGMSRVIPKPGPWMLRLRIVLGLALLATGAWLLWVLGRTAGTQAQISVVLLSLIVSAGAYAVGRLQRMYSERTRALGISLSVIALGALLALPLEAIQTNVEEGADSAIAWRIYDPAAIEQELRAQRAVFVYFTADWCITCKVNERIVLEDDAVTNALRSLDIATFRGDWTQRDESIRLELARHRKAGVPVYLVYAPDRPEAPHVLPELITVDHLVNALERAAQRRAI